jgi:hypothetical protein
MSKPVRDVSWRASDDEGGCATCGGFMIWARHSQPPDALPLVEMLCASCEPPPAGTKIVNHELIARSSAKYRRLQKRVDRIFTEVLTAQPIVGRPN